MSQQPAKIRIVCISDTHNAHSSISLPKGDILIHAGDLTNQGTYNEIKKAIDWIAKSDFSVKVVVAGNHDLALDCNYALKHTEGWGVVPTDEDMVMSRDLLLTHPNIVYLQHSDAVIHVPSPEKDDSVALHIFGSPYSPDRGKQNWAFQYGDDVARSLWSAVPQEIDVLITHTPPSGYCDASRHWAEGGCASLAGAMSQIRPMVHICGHCHEGRGAAIVQWDDANGSDGVCVDTWDDPGLGNKKQSILDLTGKRHGGSLQRGRQTAVVNASMMANSHGRERKLNKPIVIDLLVPPKSGRLRERKDDLGTSSGSS